MKKECTALDVVSAVMEHWVLKYGKMKALLSDGAGNMASQLMLDVCKIMRVKKLQSSPRYPQGDGQIERVWPSVTKAIQAVYSKDMVWSSQLAKIAYAHNTATHASTGLPPWLMRFGRMPKPIHGFIESAEELRPAAAPSEYALQLADEMYEIFEIAEESMIKANPRLGARTSKPQQRSQVGGLVLRHEASPRKLEPERSGPYEVTAQDIKFG